jgi:hypothetical protein
MIFFRFNILPSNLFLPKSSESVLGKPSNIIPAKAGIQIVEFTSWITAFAGMTLTILSHIIAHLSGLGYKFGDVFMILLKNVEIHIASSYLCQRVLGYKFGKVRPKRLHKCDTLSKFMSRAYLVLIWVKRSTFPQASATSRK